MITVASYMKIFSGDTELLIRMSFDKQWSLSALYQSRRKAVKSKETFHKTSVDGSNNVVWGLSVKRLINFMAFCSFLIED